MTWRTRGTRYRVPTKFFDQLQAIVDPSAEAGALLTAFAAHARKNDDTADFGDERALQWKAGAINTTIEFAAGRTMARYQLRDKRLKAKGKALKALELRITRTTITGPASVFNGYEPPLYGAGGITVRLYPATPADEAAVRAASDRIAALFKGLPPAYEPSD